MTRWHPTLRPHLNEAVFQCLFCAEVVVSSQEDERNDLNRLQRALHALAADLDVIERRPHLVLRRSAKSSGGRFHGVERFVENFASAVEKARLGP